MVKRIFLVPIVLLFCSSFVWAQRGAAQEDDRAARRQWEEDQRADEYATSLRRRDWLKDRLILQLGMGTKFPAMGANWFGFGAGVEYITRWHVAGFISGGFIPAHEDPVYPDLYNLDGGMGWRLGLAYYMFPKNPIHLGFHASYGTVFYDHESDDHGAGVRNLITCRGYEFDVSISYLSDQWYFIQAIIGVYTIGNGLKDGGNTWGRTNDSWWEDPDQDYAIVSLVPSTDPRKEAIPPVGVVFGIGIGFAFEEFFPDETEIRRRERESSRGKPTSQFRTTPSRKPVPAKRNNRRVVEDEDEDEE